MTTLWRDHAAAWQCYGLAVLWLGNTAAWQCLGRQHGGNMADAQ